MIYILEDIMLELLSAIIIFTNIDNCYQVYPSFYSQLSDDYLPDDGPLMIISDTLMLLLSTANSGHNSESGVIGGNVNYINEKNNVNSSNDILSVNEDGVSFFLMIMLLFCFQMKLHTIQVVKN